MRARRFPIEMRKIDSEEYICGGVLDTGMWRMRTNAELYDLCKGPDILTAIKQGRTRWAGHVQRMTEERAVKKVFSRGTGGRRARGRSRRRCR